MTKTLQRCTHDSNRRRSQFWLLYLTLEFKNTHTLTQTHTKTHELNTFESMSWCWCWQATLNHSFLKTFSVSCILFVSSFSFILSVAFVCGFYWLYSFFTHSHHCYHQRKILHFDCDCECEANASHDHKAASNNTTNTNARQRFIVWDFFQFRYKNFPLFSRCFFLHTNFLFALNLCDYFARGDC